MANKYRAHHGLAILIETDGRTVLFDTGDRTSILLGNLERMSLGIDPEDIDIVVISHEHRDHFGALEELLTVNDNVTVYIPYSMSERFKDYYRVICSMVMEVSRPTRIAEGVYCTGDCLEEINEQSLVISTEKGLVLVVGCAHPGFRPILERTREISEEPIHLVIGGYHLEDKDSKILELARLMKEYEVETIAPCHCTPVRAARILKKMFEDNYLEVGVGSTIEL